MDIDTPQENRTLEDSTNTGDETTPSIQTPLPQPNTVAPPPEVQPPPEQNSIPAFPERKTTPVHVQADPNSETLGSGTSASVSTDNESDDGSPPPPPPQEYSFPQQENPFIRLNQVLPVNVMTTAKTIDDTPPQSKNSASSDSDIHDIATENVVAKKRRNKCLRCLCGIPAASRWVTDGIQGQMSQFFYHFGRLVARFPLCAITACLILALLCGVGLIGFTPESRAEKLWVPQDNLAQTHSTYVEETFGKGSRSSYFIVTNTEALADTFTQTFLGYVFDLHNAITAASVTVDGTAYTYSSICEKPDNTNCDTISVLDAWDFSKTAMQADGDVKNTISTQTTTITGGTWVIDLIAQGRSGSGSTLAATVLKNQYKIVRQEEVVDGETIDSRAEAWEAEFINICKNYDGYNGMQVYINAERSGSDAFGEAITGDLSLVGVGYVLIIGYAAIMLGRCDCRNFKGTVAVSAVASVGLSILSAFGLCSAFGVIYGPVQSVLPFLLLGIGVDDAFVIMSDFSRVDPSLPVPERVGEAMRHAGVSITLTSITDFVAFAIGGVTVLPALRAFCLFAAVGILFDFLFQVTFFVAVLSLDTRRQRWGRAEGCPCCPAIPVGWALPQAVHDHLKANNGMDYMLDREAADAEKSYRDSLTAATGADVEAQSVKVVPNPKSFVGSYRVKPLSCCVCCLPCIYPEDFDGSVHEKYERIQSEALDRRLAAEDRAREKAKGADEDGADEEDEPVFRWTPGAVARMLLEFWFLRALHKPKTGEIPRSNERRAAMASIRFKVRKAARRNKCVAFNVRLLRTLWFFRPFSGQWFHRMVNNVYAPILLNRYLKPSILLIGVIVVGVGIYGATTLKQDFSESQFIPDGSYLLDYLDINDKYFSFGPPWSVVFKETDAYANRSGFDAYRTAMEGLTQWVQADTISFWYTDYKTYLTNNGLNIDTVTESQFYSNLVSFLNANQRYQGDVIMPTTTSVSAHRFGGQYNLLTNSDQYVGAMDDSRDAVNQVVSPLDLDAFAFSFLFISWESFKVIEAELIQNMCLAIVAVFLIAMFLVGHPWMACLVTLAVGFTILCMMGFASLWGLSIDSVFVINVVIAIGLSVDYSAHIGHAFQTNWGSRNKRAIEAVQGMGEGVLNGAISTFLAVLVLAWSASYVFRVFFVQLFLVVLFGVFHGLVMLPVVLTYIGPAGLPAPAHTDETEESGSPKPSVKV